MTKTRSDLAHYRDEAESQDVLMLRSFAGRLFETLLPFLQYLSETRIYPRVITVRQFVEDAYGRNLILAVDDGGQEQKIFTDQQLKPGCQYFMHPTTNPIRIFPILIQRS